MSVLPMILINFRTASVRLSFVCSKAILTSVVLGEASISPHDSKYSMGLYKKAWVLGASLGSMSVPPVLLNSPIPPFGPRWALMPA